jgi:glucose/arabinose dehydrogenase
MARWMTGVTHPLSAPFAGGILIAAALSVASLAGCYRMRGSSGGGQADVAGSKGSTLTRKLDPTDVALPPGYRIEVVASSLNMPSAVSFDAEGRIYVVESGYAYGESYDTPRILELGVGDERRVLASGENPPWNGIAFHQGNFYVSEGGAKQPGRILRITPRGEVSAVVEGMPSRGDHHTNGPAIGPDGMIYFSQGTVTNSAVVGVDNHAFGWLARFPDLHDVPCRDITLKGESYASENPLTPADDRVETGAFVPFGTKTERGQVVQGKVPCSGAVLRVAASGGPIELVAWGLRNPFGMAFAPDGRLFVTDNAYDERGSRPVFGSGDYLWHVKSGAWYGWPDYAGGRPLAMARFTAPGKEPIAPVLAEAPSVPPPPSAEFGVHSSSTGLDFARNPAFGHVGEAFVAQFGDMAPAVGKVLFPVGFKVVRADPATGVVADFATNEGKKHGPASALGRGGLERPVAARFNPAGDALYVVDYGVMVVGEGGPSVRKHTGVLWRISRVRQ